MNRQSPIDINTEQVGPVAPWRSRLRVTHWDTTPAEVVLENNGHSLKLTFQYPNDEIPTLTGGPLDQPYKLAEIHYHVDEKNKKGSEHTIDGYQFSAEAHMVFFNPKYGTFSNAVYYSDGLSVIGRFYEASIEDSSPKYAFNQYLDNVKSVGSKYSILTTLFTLEDLFGSLEFNYYSYPGSLTTPPCMQSVQWIVIDTPLLVQADDINNIAELDGDEDIIAPNFRPTQRGNSRTINYYKNF